MDVSYLVKAYLNQGDIESDKKQLVPFWDIYVGLTVAYAIISIFFV